MPPRRISRAQVIGALEVILEALREAEGPSAIPLVGPDSSRPGRACPDHLRELVRSVGAAGLIYKCPVEGCRYRAAN